eukprot:2508587-Prymnesium_polylepis.1
MLGDYERARAPMSTSHPIGYIPLKGDGRSCRLLLPRSVPSRTRARASGGALISSAVTDSACFAATRARVQLRRALRRGSSGGEHGEASTCAKPDCLHTTPPVHGAASHPISENGSAAAVSQL